MQDTSRKFERLEGQPDTGVYAPARIVEDTRPANPLLVSQNHQETALQEIRKDIESIRKAVFFVQMELAVFMFIVLLLL